MDNEVRTSERFPGIAQAYDVYEVRADDKYYNNGTSVRVTARI